MGFIQTPAYVGDFHTWSVDWTFDRKHALERLLAMLTKTTNSKKEEVTNDMR